MILLSRQTILSLQSDSRKSNFKTFFQQITSSPKRFFHPLFFQILVVFEDLPCFSHCCGAHEESAFFPLLWARASIGNDGSPRSRSCIRLRSRSFPNPSSRFRSCGERELIVFKYVYVYVYIVYTYISTARQLHSLSWSWKKSWEERELPEVSS